MKQTLEKYEYKWRNGIKEILTSVGRIDLLNARYINNPRAVKLSITRALSDIRIQMWNANHQKLKRILNLKLNLNLKNT